VKDGGKTSDEKRRAARHDDKELSRGKDAALWMRVVSPDTAPLRCSAIAEAAVVWRAARRVDVEPPVPVVGTESSRRSVAYGCGSGACEGSGAAPSSWWPRRTAAADSVPDGGMYVPGAAPTHQLGAADAL